MNPGKGKIIGMPQNADNSKIKLFHGCNHSDTFIQEKQAAAKHLDLAIKTTPWALTDNYVSRERENRGSQVAFAGPGDPTGKGRGFSFVKDTRRVCTVISSLVATTISQVDQNSLPLKIS